MNTQEKKQEVYVSSPDLQENFDNLRELVVQNSKGSSLTVSYWILMSRRIEENYPAHPEIRPAINYSFKTPIIIKTLNEAGLPSEDINKFLSVFTRKYVTGLLNLDQELGNEYITLSVDVLKKKGVDGFLQWSEEALGLVKSDKESDRDKAYTFVSSQKKPELSVEQLASLYKQ